MHTRRFSTLILGLWLAGSLFMMAVAVENFQGVDRLLEAPAPAARQYIKVLGVESARTLLRHQVAELNRFFFENWELVQLALAIVLIVTLLFATNGDKIYVGGAGLLLIIVIAEHWLVTPQIKALGRAIDFIPAAAPSLERIKFWRFHHAYTALEIGKLAVLAALTVRLLIFRSRHRTHRRKKADLVNDANHG